ncbi:MAG: thiamine phosphate synthase [Micrococcales bacterium]|nr:MAG: thiamine phosphate synthase [Micrococcales bacterium]PIE27521.1 MAG: thiamine phosphate synthase [Micrococcales bacterium]
MPEVDYSLYLVTDPAMCAAHGLRHVVHRAVSGGASIVQVRAKNASTAELIAQVQMLRATVGVPVLVNDDVDAAAHAHGVHLGPSDTDPLSARQALGPSALIGLSVSSADQAQAAAQLPAGTVDYLGVGPVWATATKPNAAAPLGPAGLPAIVRAAAGLPCVAIGGIDTARVGQLRGLGLAGICSVSEICTAQDPGERAQALLRAWQGPHTPAGPARPASRTDPA